MKLYYSPGACSLADHIALHEAGLGFAHEKVDLKAKTTESGGDFTEINPKGYVPALEVADGVVLTENIAILAWIADQKPDLAPTGDMGRYWLLEMLAFISTEIHKSFKPFFSGAGDDEKAKAKAAIEGRFDLIVDMMEGDYLFGDQVSVADAYLFVMLLWAKKNAIELPEELAAFQERMMARDSVKTAMKHEGLG